VHMEAVKSVSARDGNKGERGEPVNTVSFGVTGEQRDTHWTSTVIDKGQEQVKTGHTHFDYIVFRSTVFQHRHSPFE